MNASLDQADELQEIVRSTLYAVVPERANELLRIWEKYPTRFQLAEDVDGDQHFVMEAGGFGCVRFNHRTMRLFWLASFLLWEGYVAFHHHVETGETDMERFNELYDCFVNTKVAANADDVEWPAGIPAPGVLVDHQPGDPARVAGELAIFSVSWAILHEIRHLMHAEDGIAAKQDDVQACRDEEISCDLFATDFLLRNVPDFARDTGQDPDGLKMKRQAAIYASLFAMMLVAEGAWGETATHPPLQVRLERTVEEIGSFGFHQVAGAIAASAFITYRLRFPDAPDPLRTRGFSTEFDYDLDALE